MNKKLRLIFDYLKELFPNPETELHYSTPFQLVVAVMLSAQATDKQVNKVTGRLFEEVETPEDLVRIGFKSFEKSISSVNYYKSKAKHIFETAELLVENRKKLKKVVQNGGTLCEEYSLCSGGTVEENGGIPDSLEELMKLPGIGIKTAKLIAHVLYAKPFIAVDTHIHRVANRLGILLPPTPSKIKGATVFSPEKTSELLEKLIPDSAKDIAHHGLVLFGRYHCMARNPKCDICKLKDICERYKMKSSPFQGEKKRGVG